MPAGTPLNQAELLIVELARFFYNSSFCNYRFFCSGIAIYQ